MAEATAALLKVDNSEAVAPLMQLAADNSSKGLVQSDLRLIDTRN